MLIVAAESVMLAFMYFISRFYEFKFGQRTYCHVFLAAAASMVALAAVAALGFYPYYLVTLANALALAVLFVFGVRLFRLMTGVTK
jgi:hypothetical protein